MHKEKDRQPENAATQKNNPHDKGYKRIFSIKKNFLDFLKKYVGLEWAEGLTVDDIELVDKEFITDQFDTYESDLVYKIHKDGEEAYLFFLQEMQSSNDFTMPFRILVYMVAIWLDYFKNTDKNERRKKGFKLPAIIPLVLYNGEDSWTAERRFRNYVDRNSLFGRYTVDFEYILISVDELEREFIESSNTLVDNVLLSDRIREKEEWIGSLKEISMRVNQMSVEDQNEWFTWYMNAFRLGDEEGIEHFISLFKRGDDKMCSSVERILTKERESGLKQGRVNGMVETLKELGYSDELILKKIMEKFGMTKEEASKFLA